MESHVDEMELFEVKIQLNQLKDLQLESKKLDKKIEKAIHQLEHKINMGSLQADSTLMPSHLPAPGLRALDTLVKRTKSAVVWRKVLSVLKVILRYGRLKFFCSLDQKKDQRKAWRWPHLKI